MQAIFGFIFLVCLACACLVVLAAFQDSWALKVAAILRARVEARVAYREKYAAAIKRLHQEFGLEEVA